MVLLVDFLRSWPYWLRLFVSLLVVTLNENVVSWPRTSECFRFRCKQMFGAGRLHLLWHHFPPFNRWRHNLVIVILNYLSQGKEQMLLLPVEVPVFWFRFWLSFHSSCKSVTAQLCRTKVKSFLPFACE